jgi:hypothetical protein
MFQNIMIQTLLIINSQSMIIQIMLMSLDKAKPVN